MAEKCAKTHHKAVSKPVSMLFVCLCSGSLHGALEETADAT